MLTEDQRQELEQLGPDTVRALVPHFALGGSGARVFRCRDFTKSDITDWLAEKAKAEADQQAATLSWTKSGARGAWIAAFLPGGQANSPRCGHLKLPHLT